MVREFHWKVLLHGGGKKFLYANFIEFLFISILSSLVFFSWEVKQPTKKERINITRAERCNKFSFWEKKITNIQIFPPYRETEELGMFISKIYVTETLTKHIDCFSSLNLILIKLYWALPLFGWSVLNFSLSLFVRRVGNCSPL